MPLREMPGQTRRTVKVSDKTVRSKTRFVELSADPKLQPFPAKAPPKGKNSVVRVTVHYYL
jgi:hypothetical protein